MLPYFMYLSESVAAKLNLPQYLSDAAVFYDCSVSDAAVISVVLHAQ